MNRMNTYKLFFALTALLTSATFAAPLINSGDDWRYFEGTAVPQTNWQSIADTSLDGTWQTGPGGFGYGDGDDATVLNMSTYRTVYIRQEFTVNPGDLIATDEVILSVDYDDAYVAYLDGVEVARSSNAPGSVGTEPAFNAGPSGTREAGTAETNNLGLAPTILPSGTHVLAVLGMNESLTSSDFSLIVNLSTQSPPPPLHWTLADSPIILSSTFSVANGQTLIIDAGVEVQCPSGTNAISCNGVIQANGTTANPIRFVPTTSGGTWGRLEFLGSSESSLAYCDFERANSSGIIRGRNSDVKLDHCRFIDVNVQMVDLIDTSCTIEYCEFDSISSGELLHFSNMPSSGHAYIAYNRFGIPGTPATGGYNDIIDFTGGNRPGPIVRFIGNIFLSAVDDVFDMDGTDAHIEGNIFFNVNKEASRSSSSNPITTGAAGGDDSELVIARNIFVNCEHNVLIKDGGTVLIQNNTTLTMVNNPVSNNTDTLGNEAPGIVMFGEPWRNYPFGAGVYFEGNIAADLQVTDPWPLFASAVAENGCFLRQDFNCIENFPQPGTDNLSSDPLFVDRTVIDYTNILQKLALQPGSPCVGTGPNGLDRGAIVPTGASINGAPVGTTSETTATLTVAGPGIWAYQWRINGGAWSSDVSLVPQAAWDGGPFTTTMFDNAPAIELMGLTNGDYMVEVRGKNSAGDWQETPTATQTWTVQIVDPNDLDGDGMPNTWETTYNLDPNDPADATLDADGDGTNNLSEYIAGTLPNDATSKLALTGTAISNNDIVITFDSVAGKSYQLQFSPNLEEGSWTAVDTIPSAAGGPISMTEVDGYTNVRRFYRVITPAP
jgi:hypothetical protein